jgi:6-phosphogluconolactonase (cycloisomerase 2 family)
LASTHRGGVGASEPTARNNNIPGDNPMKTTTLAAAALATLLLGCAAAPTLEPLPTTPLPPPARQWLVTANENKVELRQGVVSVRGAAPPDSVSIFDIAASPARLIARVDVPVSVVGPPQSVALAPDLSVAIVSSATRVDPADATKVIDGNLLSVVDLQANPPAVVQSLSVGPAPAGVAVSPDGTLVLLATRTDSAVTVFALVGKRLRQTARIALPDKSVPGGVAFAPDGKRALVTRDGDNAVTVLAIDNGEVKLAGRDFFTGMRPYGVHISPSGDWAIVGNVGRGQGDADTITLVDMKAPGPRAVHHATVGPTAEGVAMSPDSRLVAAVVHDGSNRPPTSPLFRENGRIVVFRIDAGKLVPLGSAPIGKWSQGAAFSADSKRLYVQNMVERDVQVFRVEANAVVDSGERIALPGGGAAMAAGAR